MLNKNFRRKLTKNVIFWKKELCYYFLKHYQNFRECQLALMNHDDYYFNILKVELEKPITKFSRKFSNENDRNFAAEKKQMNEIQYFINDIYSEEADIRNISVKKFN